MMKNNEKKKGNNAKKILPAAGMLALSASMLATSTYAWFTMNKDVEVTGLSMQATASSGLEISLGALGAQRATHTVSVDAPAADDISWKRAITINEYYSAVGKLLPASSDTALSIFTVPDADVFAGGHAVKDAATISMAAQKDSATMTLQTYNSNGSYSDLQTITAADSSAAEVSKETAAKGNYIDIPMWIRSSSNTTALPIYATVSITDPNTGNGSDLIKAVRVAIIPIASSAADSSTCTIDYASSEYIATATTASTVSPLSGGAASIFGLKANKLSASMDADTAQDWPTYHSKVIKAAGSYSTANDTSTLGTTTLVEARGAGTGQITPTAVFSIPAATSDKYASVGFIARVWLEGESIYCEDATANQDWNIDFHFSTEDTALAAIANS